MVSTPGSISVKVKGEVDPPIRAIDVTNPLSHQDDFCDWLRAHCVDPNLAFRIVLISDEHFVAHCFALNESGAKYVHREGPKEGEVALDEPVVIRILEPMPEAQD
jgi:hypothetical protein